MGESEVLSSIRVQTPDLRHSHHSFVFHGPLTSPRGRFPYDLALFAHGLGGHENVRNAFLVNHQFKKLGLVGVTWHWLHHANATPLDAVGTPLGTVQALLGHSPSEVTREIYLHSMRSRKSRIC